MKQNKILLFGALIFFSVSITLSIQQILSVDQVLPAEFLLAGAITSGTSYVNLTTTTNVAISVSSNIDFGSGYINSSFAAANITSNITYNRSSGWINTSEAWNYSTTKMVLNNTGNTYLNVTFSANQSVAAWIGGTSPDARAFFGDNENNSCTGTYNTQQPQINTTEQAVCTSTTKGTGLDFYDLSDEIMMNVQLLLPNNLATGQRSTTLTFTATANQ